jgi:hypothetical protein
MISTSGAENCLRFGFCSKLITLKCSYLRSHVSYKKTKAFERTEGNSHHFLYVGYWKEKEGLAPALSKVRYREREKTQRAFSSNLLSLPAAASLPLSLCADVDVYIPPRFVIILLIKLAALLQIENLFCSQRVKKGRQTF